MPCLRIMALALAFAAQAHVGAADAVECNIYIPPAAPLDGEVAPDAVLALWDLRGQAFITAYISLLPRPASVLLLPYLQLFDAPDSELNPFTAYLEREGFATSGLWLPGLQESELLAQMRAACGMQCGFHLASSSMARLINDSEDMEEHFAAACELGELPVDSLPPTSETLLFTTAFVGTHGEHTASKRKRIDRHLRRRASQFKLSLIHI